jgi:hypothetical protein
MQKQTVQVPKDHPFRDELEKMAAVLRDGGQVPIEYEGSLYMLDLEGGSVNQHFEAYKDNMKVNDVMVEKILRSRKVGPEGMLSIVREKKNIKNYLNVLNKKQEEKIEMRRKQYVNFLKDIGLNVRRILSEELDYLKIYGLMSRNTSLRRKYGKTAKDIICGIESDTKYVISHPKEYLGVVRKIARV